MFRPVHREDEVSLGKLTDRNIRFCSNDDDQRRDKQENEGSQHVVTRRGEGHIK